MPNWKKVIVSGSAAEITTLKSTGLSTQSSEQTSLMINSSGVVGTRELGSLAFSSATYNNYVHPTTAGNKHIPTGGSTGQFLKYSKQLFPPNRSRKQSHTNRRFFGTIPTILYEWCSNLGNSFLYYQYKYNLHCWYKYDTDRNYFQCYRYKYNLFSW